MSDMRDWLNALGLEHYADAFAENGVDFVVLPKLTPDDLKDIGVTRVGDRRKLIEAIETLRTSPTDQVDTAAEPIPPTAGGREAERRQLTVMFCDLVGSTALSEKLDPEDLRALMAAYQKACGGVVERYEGHVAQYLGDGLMVYFGWPQAHEDDAERAVRAGLGVVEAVKAVAAPEPRPGLAQGGRPNTELQVRVGIATGPVVVGETGAGDAAVPKAAVGETPNLAARLQSLAGPDQVVIAPSTHRLTGGAFDYDDLGEQTLKGIVEPVRVWRVLGESQADGRFEAQTVGGLTPFVGRETEVAMLLDRWEQAKDCEGQVVLLEGEPGIGKSRITQELRKRLSSEPHTRLRYQCSPYHTNAPFYPIITQLERAAGFDRDDTVDQKLDKLEAVLAVGISDVPSVAPLVAVLLSLPADRYPPLNLSPQRQKERTIEALADQVAGLADSQPVLMIFEDAHWSDPTTLEALGEVIARLESMRALLVVTQRPEFESPWATGGNVSAYTVTRLPRRLGADMVSRVTGGKSLPDEVLDQIVAKTDGVPLFVEELTKTVLEADYLRDAGDHYKLDGPLPPLAIPSTLQDSLMARLDRLSPIKEVAQAGACVGREFSYKLLAAVSPLRDNELRDALQQLVNRELVFRRGAPPDATYTFKHALVQDAAYGSLLKGYRQELHGRIADALEANGIAAAEPELVAHHMFYAGRFAEAVGYWIEAGQRGVATAAHKEAQTHLENGLAAVDNVTDTELRDRYRLQLCLATAAVHNTLTGWGHEIVGGHYRSAKALAKDLNEPQAELEATIGLHYHLVVGDDVPGALLLAHEARERADALGEFDKQFVTRQALAQALFYTGQLAAANAYFDEAVELYDADRLSYLGNLFGGDLGVYANVYWSVATWCLGFPTTGKARLDAGFEIARTSKMPVDLTSALRVAALFYVLLREPELALVNARECQDLANTNGFTHALLYSQLYEGCALAIKGEHEAAIRVLSPIILDFPAGFAKLFVPLFRLHLAEAHLACGDRSKAEFEVNSAEMLVEATGTHWIDSNIKIVAAKLHLDAGDHSVAESDLYQAIDIARSQQAKSWELRAATSLARLWQSQGKTAEAYDLLAPVYDWFTEGFDTADLKEAKALLEELRH